MKYVTKELLAAVKQVNKVIPTRTYQPILNCVQLTSSMAIGTNLDIWLQVNCHAISGGNPIVTPAKRLLEILAKVKTDTVEIIGQSTVEFDKSYVQDANGNSFSISTFDYFDYPAYHFASDKQAVEIDGLAQAILTVNPFAAGSDTGSVIGGVAINTQAGHVCATDGNRLSSIQLATLTPALAPAIVPSVSLNSISGLLSKASTLMVQVGDREIRLGNSDWQATLRLISGQYPAFIELFPAKFIETVVIKRQELIDAIKPLTPTKLAKGMQAIVLFKDCQAIGSYKEGVGKDATKTVTGTVKLNQSIPYCALNPVYLTDCLKSFTGETVTLGYNGPLQPLVFSDNTTHKHLLMPIETKEMSNERLNKSQAVRHS